METAIALRKLPFHRYANHAGHSVVAAYAVLPDGLQVQFADGRVVLYNHDCPGRKHVSRMKVLAREGRGLGGYIVRHVGNRFAARLADDDLGDPGPPAQAQSSTRQNAALR